MQEGRRVAIWKICFIQNHDVTRNTAPIESHDPKHSSQSALDCVRRIGKKAVDTVVLGEKIVDISEVLPHPGGTCRVFQG